MEEKIIQDIVELEWQMFTSVKSMGDRASCQEDRQTFMIMRTSQAETWNESLLRSYYHDLLHAKSQNRNLMTEKYARMMETTLPDEYQKFAHLLPPIDPETNELIEKIVLINVEWREKTAQLYPNLIKRGRVIHTNEDSCVMTSFETYLRGELRTFSPATIRLYNTMTMEYLDRGDNLENIYLFNMIKKYGYETLEAAEQAND